MSVDADIALPWEFGKQTMAAKRKPSPPPPPPEPPLEMMELSKPAAVKRPAEPEVDVAKYLAYAKTADDILTAEFPPPRWAVPGLLSSGLSILAGKPKKGKSWLALQIACAVASGGMVFGERVEKGAVLYCALEDGARRLQDRMKAQGWPRGLPVTFYVGREFHAAFGSLSEPKRMDAFLAYVGACDFRLVIIDTAARAFANVDWNDASKVIPALSPLQSFAIERDIAVLLIDHFNKLTSEDLIDVVLGSVSKTGVADAVLGLFREQGKHYAKLVVTGRDMDTRTLRLEWDGLTKCWQCVGDEDEIELTEAQQAVLNVVRELEIASVTEIARVLNANRGNVYKRLCELCDAGAVRRVEHHGVTCYAPTR